MVPCEVESMLVRHVQDHPEAVIAVMVGGRPDIDWEELEGHPRLRFIYTAQGRVQFLGDRSKVCLTVSCRWKAGAISKTIGLFPPKHRYCDYPFGVGALKAFLRKALAPKPPEPEPVIRPVHPRHVKKVHFEGPVMREKVEILPGAPGQQAIRVISQEPEELVLVSKTAIENLQTGINCLQEDLAKLLGGMQTKRPMKDLTTLELIEEMRRSQEEYQAELIRRSSGNGSR